MSYLIMVLFCAGLFAQEEEHTNAFITRLINLEQSIGSLHQTESSDDFKRLQSLQSKLSSLNFDLGFRQTKIDILKHKLGLHQQLKQRESVLKDEEALAEVNLDIKNTKKEINELENEQKKLNSAMAPIKLEIEKYQAVTDYQSKRYKLYELASSVKLLHEELANRLRNKQECQNCKFLPLSLTQKIKEKEEELQKIHERLYYSEAACVEDLESYQSFLDAIDEKNSSVFSKYGTVVGHKKLQLENKELRKMFYHLANIRGWQKQDAVVAKKISLIRFTSQAKSKENPLNHLPLDDAPVEKLIERFNLTCLKYDIVFSADKIAKLTPILEELEKGISLCDQACLKRAHMEFSKVEAIGNISVVSVEKLCKEIKKEESFFSTRLSSVEKDLMEMSSLLSKCESYSSDYQSIKNGINNNSRNSGKTREAFESIIKPSGAKAKEN